MFRGRILKDHMTKIKNYVLPSVAYIKHLNKDCLYQRNILHNMSVSTGSEFEEAKQWCNENSNSGAFTVYQERAYFWPKDCEINLFPKPNRVVFVKRKNQNSCLEY